MCYSIIVIIIKIGEMMIKLNTIFFWIAMANVVAVSFFLGSIHPIPFNEIPTDTLIFITCLVLYLICSMIMSYYWATDPEKLYE